MFGILQGFEDRSGSRRRRCARGCALRRSAAFGGSPPPIAYVERLKKIPGIKTVSYADGLIASYQKPTQGVYVLALERSKAWLTLIPEILKVTPRDLDALHNTRNGVLISADIGSKYGWRIGDRIPLTSPILQANGSGNWVFEVVGMFTAHEVGQGGYIVANYDYLDEARAMNKGTVRNFYAVAADPRRAGEVIEAIDAAFRELVRRDPHLPFRENAQQQLRSIGDLNFVIRSILSAVLVALLFSTSTMMMQTIRERRPELAVLKSLGFTDRAVFVIVLAEALITYVAAALVGLALAWGVFPVCGEICSGARDAAGGHRRWSDHRGGHRAHQRGGPGRESGSTAGHRSAGGEVIG